MSAIADIWALVNSNPNKTLDELFLEHLGLGASDAPLKVLLSNGVSFPTVSTQVGNSFSPAVDGNLRVICVIADRSHAGNTDENAYIRVLEEDNIIATKIITPEEITQIPKNFSVDFNVKKGKNYHIKLETKDASSTSPTCDEIKVCGSISDPTLIE